MMPSGSATRLLLLLPVASCALRGAVPAVLRSVGAPAATMMRGQARMAAALAESLSEAPAEVSFNNSWYAVGFAHELSSEEPFATRLWGEPVVLYRDADGEPVCVRDVCPHRSAPLSMGEMQDGVLRCFYHGWGFGAKGACVNVPTGSATAGVCATGSSSRLPSKVLSLRREEEVVTTPTPTRASCKNEPHGASPRPRHRR